MKRIRVYLLLFTLILPSLTACNTDTSKAQNNAETTTEQVVETTAAETELESTIDSVDYNGYTYKILTSDIKPSNIAYHEVFNEGTNGEIVNDAVYERNSALEEKYNIKIEGMFDGFLDYSSFEKNAVAGDDVYSVIMAGQGKSFAYARNGYFLEMNALDNLQMDEIWWKKSYNDGASIGGKNFFSVCSANLASFESVPVLFFNKLMIEDLGVNLPYQLVLDGKWTYDRLHEYCAEISRDLDGDGTYTEKDMYGLILNSYGALTFTYGGGFSFTEKDDNDIPKFTYSEDFVSWFQTFVEEMIATDVVLFGNFYDNTVEVMKAAFKENRGFFYNEMLTYSNHLRDMDTDFGIVPMPKHDEKQENYSAFYHESSSSTVAIPVTVTDIDRSSRVLEDLAFYSHKFVYPEYIEDTIKTKAARDEYSAQMVDIALSNISCDVVFSAPGVTNVLRQLFTEKSTNVVSKLESIRSTQESNLSTFAEQYAAIGH